MGRWTCFCLGKSVVSLDLFLLLDSVCEKIVDCSICQEFFRLSNQMIGKLFHVDSAHLCIQVCISRVPDQNGVSLLYIQRTSVHSGVHIEGSRPEWCISTIYHKTCSRSTWDDHLFEIVLPKPCCVGHLDLKFTLHPLCITAPNIEVCYLSVTYSLPIFVFKYRLLFCCCLIVAPISVGSKSRDGSIWSHSLHKVNTSQRCMLYNQWWSTQTTPTCVSRRLVPLLTNAYPGLCRRYPHMRIRVYMG